MFKLETERLILRESVVEDAQALFDVNSDPEVMKYTGDVAFPSVDVMREMIANYPDYKKYGYGRWTTIEKASGAIMGFCGLKYLEDINEVDIGYRWKKKFWNKGYATEASLSCLEFGFKQLKLEQIVAQVLPDNRASIRVLEKIGMTYWKQLNTEENPGLFYRIRKDEYLSNQ